MTVTQEDTAALLWREAVTEAIAAHGGELDWLDSVPFVARLDEAAGLDPDDPELTARVSEAVAAHQAETLPAELDHIPGRLLEARANTPDGCRAYRVQIIAAGTSKNKNSYPMRVLQASAHLYEGAKAYDHHRTPDELRSSTIAGLVGSYRNVEANTDGLEGDLILLPSATHTAEALDASLDAQAQGRPPLVGISHDAMTVLKTVGTGTRRVREAVAITKVNSADVVADPSAGGKATRVLAGGIETDQSEQDERNEEEDDVTVTKEAVLAAFQDATDDELAAAGLTRATEAGEPQEPAVGGIWGKMMIERMVESAGLPMAVAATIAEQFKDVRVTEGDIAWQIKKLQDSMAIMERADLAPTMSVEVVKESYDKKVEALDAFFAGDYRKGYKSFRDAYLDFTGYRANRLGGEDLSRRILRESFGGGYDSTVRTTESMDAGTWAQVLGDSVTRRLVAAYSIPGLSSWRQIVSSITPVMDFRTQRIGRIGGYGVLPAVLEGGPYQPLTSPGDEEATYAITKRGGTEDVTLEMIANDDVRAIQQVPTKLGRAAAQTLYRFVWDMLVNNDTCTFDSVALFHSGSHANTDTSAALTQTTLGVGRRKMIEQAAYGDSVEVLGITPRYLVVPPELEEIAFQLCTSAVAVPATPAGPSDIPNIHQANGLAPILVPYLTDANDWFLVGDPGLVPTIEVGFYQGREEPELFTQNDPNSGSVFNSDVFTWKVRHIYSGTILDYRGFYRGQG